MRRRGVASLSAFRFIAAFAGACLLLPQAAAAHHHHRHKAVHPPAADSAIDDLSGAVPAQKADELPSTASQYHSLESEIARTRPAVDQAKAKSTVLRAEADELRRRLIATAARVQALEQEKIGLDTKVAQLTGLEHARAAAFAKRRVQVTRLLAVLERMQSDPPPVMTIQADDALAAAHSSMLLGATLPRLYSAAAALAAELETLKRTRAELALRSAQAARNAGSLADARNQLDQLLAIKVHAADTAQSLYGDLASKLDAAAGAAANLETLLQRVAALRAQPGSPSLVVVDARNNATGQGLQRGGLLRPVIGTLLAGDEAQGGPHTPGVSFLAPPSAQVIAPADSEVLFAGPYHNASRALILQMAGGYDLVLAGLDRVDVRLGDQLLAGEPVGRMPATGPETRLYFELRQNGKGVNPAPWLEVDLRKAKRS
ncbi:MAG TPA: peptidoglycan DD-metalloendopeptidase family protein [Rhizomicrobium sp.]